MLKTDPRKRQSEVAVALHVSSCRIGEEKVIARILLDSQNCTVSLSQFAAFRKYDLMNNMIIFCT